jgi:hypothetical protein
MMNLTRTRRWVKEVVERDPIPPREISLWETAHHVYREESSLLLIGLGCVLGVAGAAVFAIASGSALIRAGGLAVSAALVTWAIIRPLLVAIRVRRAVSAGLYTSARVVEVMVISRRDAGLSVDSLRYGLATGSWEVIHPVLGPFTAEFKTDAPWTKDLAAGARIDVIVDPRQPEVQLDLGHHGQTEAAS